MNAGRGLTELVILHGKLGETDNLFGRPIQGLYDWNDQSGPARDVLCRLTSIDVAGAYARVRIDADGWTVHRFTDFTNLVKFDGQWKVVSKVFYLRPSWRLGSWQLWCAESRDV